MNSNKWYSKAYRRNLVDMHIDDWSGEFLSKFDPDDYAAQLKKAHIQAPMIYLQSHAGHCYWPTKTGHMHAAFDGNEDMIKKLLVNCRREGMFTVGYYSLIYNTVEEDKHPDRRLFGSEDGLSARQKGGRYGHCCPNNPEYLEFVKAQIAEMAEFFRDDSGLLLDGMFYDMTFWPVVCRCEHCKELYFKATGKREYPRQDWNDPDWLS
nr:alpha-L-fucosidase [Clostridia bacterium]